MEDVLDLYESYDPKKPVLCVDERPFQLIDDVIQPISIRKGISEKQDYHYRHKGVAAYSLLSI